MTTKLASSLAANDKLDKENNNNNHNSLSDFSRLQLSRFSRRYLPIPETKTPDEVIGNHQQIFEQLDNFLSTDVRDIKQFIVNHMEYTLARSRYNFDDYSTYQATALSLRDRMLERWNYTQSRFAEKQVKRVCYLSIEYLIGRTMQNAVTNLGLAGAYGQALNEFGYALEELYDLESDAALGNGGLGRLAACFLDSLATLNLPACGYGIRYQYGMLHQEIRNGYQFEAPDFWLRKGNPWEICRNDISYPVRFGGNVWTVLGAGGEEKYIWDGGDVVLAVAYDTPIPGFGTLNTLTLRLWASAPSSEFDLQSFNEADYYKALRAKQNAQNITSVLYPNDETRQGKLLRLQQQYFFCSASLRDIISNLKRQSIPLECLPEKIAIQLNDTHPVIAVPELLRILIDEEGWKWDSAWDVVQNTFAFTNHTVLPEALERWAVDLFQELLPRHLMIIYEINRRFLDYVAHVFPSDPDRLARVSLIEDGPPKMIRMAHLAVLASHSINGVAAIHSEIIKRDVFRDFYELFAERFNNKTNGVTPRRWILIANPSLAKLYTQTLGSDQWITDLPRTGALREYSKDPKFQQTFAEIKRRNKHRLRNVILKVTKGSVEVDTEALFDIHVKRIHEYKRQLMNILSVVARYQKIKSLSPNQRKKIVPRVCVFAGKSAPGYAAAKCVIKMINSVADVVNDDPDSNAYLKVVFIPNYNVSLAEVIIPAADISQHISTAGTEASGTSNMKFCMNGGLILGTMDGANIEIHEEAGDDCMFVFGASANQVPGLRSGPPLPSLPPALRGALNLFKSNGFGDYGLFSAILKPIEEGKDYYLIANDFESYLRAQDAVDTAFQDKSEWTRRCIVTAVSMGKFSSDTSISQYAEKIWKVAPFPVSPEGEKK